ncbi:MAG: ABC transporter permease, partial [Myxococcota bacterium]
MINERRAAKMSRVVDQRLGQVRAAVEAVYHRHNVSAILRTCDALGVHDVHLVAGGPTSRGPSRGAERWLGLHRHDDALDALDPAMMQFDPRPSAPGGEVTRRARAPYFAAIALALVLWTVVFSVANMLLSGVIEEKSNKILDTILTSDSPLQMLIGKLLGVAAVSLTLFFFWGVLGGTLLTAITERA